MFVCGLPNGMVMCHGNGNDCVFPFSGDMMGRPADMNMSKCA